MAEPGVSKPYSLIDGEMWLDGGTDPNGCAVLVNSKTGQRRVFQ